MPSTKLVDHKIMFAGQTDRRGLGYYVYNKTPSIRQKRALASATVADEEQQKRIAHSVGRGMQGVRANWEESCLPFDSFDLSWSMLLKCIYMKLVSVVLNASINSVRTPDLLCMWHYKE